MAASARSLILYSLQLVSRVVSGLPPPVVVCHLLDRVNKLGVSEVKTVRNNLTSLKSSEEYRDSVCKISVTAPDHEATEVTTVSGNKETLLHPQTFAGLLQTQLKPKPQRKKRGTLRCRSCTECKAWCETSSRDASEWCYPCLYRKREGKSNKSGCKLRGQCKNPKAVGSEKEDRSEDDIETDDAHDETYFDVEDFEDKVTEDDHTSGPKRKEMEGTPPEKSVSQRLKDDNPEQVEGNTLMEEIPIEKRL